MVSGGIEVNQFAKISLDPNGKHLLKAINVVLKFLLLNSGWYFVLSDEIYCNKVISTVPTTRDKTVHESCNNNKINNTFQS